MKTKPSAIRRDPLKIPKPISNPAAALLRDTIAHHGITQAEAAEAMKVSKAQLTDVIRQKKAVSAKQTAGRLQDLADIEELQRADKA